MYFDSFKNTQMVLWEKKIWSKKGSYNEFVAHVVIDGNNEDVPTSRVSGKATDDEIKSTLSGLSLHSRSLRIVYNDYITSFENLLKKDNTFKIHHKNHSIVIYRTV